MMSAAAIGSVESTEGATPTIHGGGHLKEVRVLCAKDSVVEKGPPV